MKIGDKVRFLSEVGGGVVTGFQGKNIVLVEDADGFDIPMPINECVVIETDDYNINCVRPLLRQGRLLWSLRFRSLNRSVWRNRRYLFIVSPR